MKSQNDIALKEWAILLNALEEGKQTILLRKGGISEENGEFKPEHPEFFFYPTFEHESAEDIKPDWRPRLAKLEKEQRDPKRVAFRLYGVAEKVVKITDWEAAKKLSPFTQMSDQALEKRFNYGDWQGFYLFIVRVYALAVPMDMPKKAAFDGCKSWVPLGTSLLTAGAYPIIPDGAWPYTQDKIIKLVQTA